MKIKIRKRYVALVLFWTVAIASIISYTQLNMLSKRVDKIELKINSNIVKESENVKVEIYTPNKELTKLEIKTVETKYTKEKNEIVKLMVENISKTLIEKGIIHENIEVLNSFFSGKDLYINLKSLDEFNGDSKKIIYILYSISNSIIDLGGVDRVKFLVDNAEKNGVFEQYYQKNTDL